MVLCDTSGSAVSLVVAFGQADAVAWICLVIGTLVLSAGVLTGLWTSFKKAPQKTEEAIAKIDEAQAKIAEAKVQIEQTTSTVADANLEGFESAAGDATERPRRLRSRRKPPSRRSSKCRASWRRSPKTCASRGS